MKDVKNLMKPKVALLMRAKTSNHIHDQYFINQDYVKALKDANASVLLIYPQPYDELEEELKTCDGLVIPGGMDIDPYFYQQENTHSSCEPIEVDQLDLNAIEIAQRLKLPIFGICRGLQVINVALGGSLKQDIPNHSVSSDTKRLNGHKITIEKGNILYDLMGQETEVNSYHHQAIDKLASTLEILAQSEDETIEAIKGNQILAVQWHPERMTSLESTKALFKYFIDSLR